MVQDTSASPEMYLSSLDDGSCGGWGMYEDSAPSGDPEEIFDYRKLKERGIVWAITVPGTTKWLQKVSQPLRTIPTYPVTLFRRLKVMSILQAWHFCYPATLLLIPLQKNFQPYLCKRSYKHPQDDPTEFGVLLKVNIFSMSFLTN
jgi:hypothetical protein